MALLKPRRAIAFLQEQAVPRLVTSAPCQGCAPQAVAQQLGPSYLPSASIASLPLRSSRATLRTRVATEYGIEPVSAPDSYITLGLAHCFEKDDNGKLMDRMVVEPLAANSLECMANGAATCFKAVTSLTLEDALRKDISLLPEQFGGASWCSDYEFRCGAAARTWLRPHAQDNLSDIVPLGQVRSNFNFNLERKRVLNFVNVVSDEDNVKQDMSIDVYGRKEKAEGDEADSGKAEEAPKAAAAAADEDDDDLDALLSS